jgi:hypothetical protein
VTGVVDVADETVEHILNHLRPLKPGTECDAPDTIALLLECVGRIAVGGDRLPDNAALRQYAQKLDQTLVKAEELMTSPWFMLVMMGSYSDEPKTRTLSPDELDLSDEELLECGDQRRWRTYGPSRRAALAALAPIRAACAHILTPGYSYRRHSNFDSAKVWSAHMAYALMKGFSTHKITGTEGGSFWNVASLVYEAVTGKPSRSMKRACDKVLAARRKGTDSP